MPSDHPYITFFIPAYNEQEHLVVTVKETVTMLDQITQDFELLLLDDGSTDTTGTLADDLAREDPRIRVYHNDTNRGYGYTCKRAIGEAHGQYVGWVSADTLWDPEVLREVILSLGHADIITTYPTNPQERSPLRRYISNSFTHLLNFLFGLKMKYYNGGCFHKGELIKALDIYSPGLTLWAEILVRLSRQGCTCQEIGMRNLERKYNKSKAFSCRNIFGTLKIVFVLLWIVYVRDKGERNEKKS